MLVRAVSGTALLTALSTTLPNVAFADDAPSAETPAMKEAKERYARGLRLFADKDFEAARIEFAKAYELAPSYKILYNIGVCDANRNDYVSAISSLERYLSQGGNEVPPDRKTEVENLLKDIRPRVGHLDIRTNVTGAAVTVDDVAVGTSPLPKSVDVNPGLRKVTSTKSGYIPSTQAVTVAGSETQVVQLTMQPTTSITIKKGTSPLPFVLWGVTGALAIGAGITGYFAIKTSNDLSTLSNQTPPAGTSAAQYQQDLEGKRSDMRTFSIIADALTAGAVVAGATALVVTIVTFSKGKEKSAPAVSVGVRPGSLLLSGTF